MSVRRAPSKKQIVNFLGGTVTKDGEVFWPFDKYIGIKTHNGETWVMLQYTQPKIRNEDLLWCKTGSYWDELQGLTCFILNTI